MFFRIGGPIIFHSVLYTISVEATLTYYDSAAGSVSTQTVLHSVQVETRPPECSRTSEKFTLNSTPQGDATGTVTVYYGE